MIKRNRNYVKVTRKENKQFFKIWMTKLRRKYVKLQRKG